MKNVGFLKGFTYKELISIIIIYLLLIPSFIVIFYFLKPENDFLNTLQAVGWAVLGIFLIWLSIRDLIINKFKLF